MIKYLFALFLLLMPMPMYAYLTDNNTYQVPSISRPALLIPVTDTVFGTTVTRITDPTMIANDATYPRQGLRHEYARLASLNSDNTKAVVLALGGAERGNYYVIDIRNGARLRTIPRDGLDPTAMWHPTNPDMLIYRISNEIRTMNVSNGNITTLMKFPQYEYVTTREEGTVSDDWRYFAFLGYKPGANWAMADFVVADLQAKTIIGLIVNQTDIPDWIGMSASGQYVVIGFVTTSTKLYSRNLAYLRDLFPYVSHGDFAIDQNGDDVLIYFAQTSGQIAEFNNQPVLGVVRLRDGQKWAAINTYWKWGGHISGIASRKHPGWVLVSTYQNINSSQDWPFQREVFWLSINGSKEVKRIAHHHSDMGWDPSGEKDYFSEPHAVPSWDGNVATFASVWGSPFTQYDFYTVTGNFWNESSQPPPQDTTPPQFVGLMTCSDAQNNCQVFASPNVPEPALLTPYTDPTFGTKIIRVSVPAAAGNVGNLMVPNYSPNQAFNADGTLLLLFSGTGNWHLLDGKTYAYKRRLDSPAFCYDGVDTNAKWDDNDPDKIWYTCLNKLMTYSVANNTSTVYHVFGAVGTQDATNKYVKMGDYCNYADGNRRAAFRIVDGGGRVYSIFSFDIPSKTVLASKDLFTQLPIPGAPLNKMPASACISPSGNYVYVEWNTVKSLVPDHWGTEVYDAATLTFQRRITTTDIGTHSDVGYDANGDEVYVNMGNYLTSADYRTFTSIRLRDGFVVKNKMPDAFYGNIPLGVVNNWHVSMRALGLPGWALISTFTEPAQSTPDVPGVAVPMQAEIFALKLDGSGEVRRIAHVQTIRNDYFAEPHATVNRQFMKIVFGSNWRNTALPSPGSIKAFVIELQSPDTTAPSVSITSPSSGSTVSGTITVSASASDNAGVAGVQFKADGTNIGAEDTTAPYSVSWNTSAVANGVRTLTAVARDAAGNTNSSSITVNVNNIAAPQTCSDGTAINVCSATKPKYCDANRNLVDKCTACGCATGYTCNTATGVCVQSTTSNVTVYNKLTFTGKIIKNNRNKTPCSFCTLTIGLLGVSNTTTTSSTGSFTLNLYTTITPGTYTLSITINDGTRTYNFYKRIKIDSTAEKLGLKT